MEAAPKRSSARKSAGSPQFLRTAKALLLRRRTKEAINLLRRGLNLEPGADDAALLLAKSLVADKQLDEARAVLEKLVDRRESLDAFTLLLRVYLALGEAELAVALGRRAAVAFPLDRRLEELVGRAGRQLAGQPEPEEPEPEDLPTTRVPDTYVEAYEPPPLPEETPTEVDELSEPTPKVNPQRLVQGARGARSPLPGASRLPPHPPPPGLTPVLREVSEPERRTPTPTPLPSDDLGFDRDISWPTPSERKPAAPMDPVARTSPDLISAVKRLVEPDELAPRGPLLSRLLEDGPSIIDATPTRQPWEKTPRQPVAVVPSPASPTAPDPQEVGGPTPPASPGAMARLGLRVAPTRPPQGPPTVPLRPLKKGRSAELKDLSPEPLARSASQLVQLRDAEGQLHEHQIDDSRVVRPVGGELIAITTPPLEPTMNRARVLLSDGLVGHSGAATLRQALVLSTLTTARPVEERALARWWPLLLAFAVFALAAGTVTGLVVRQRARAAQCLSSARVLAAENTIPALRAALHRTREAANLGGRKAPVVALAAALHARLAVEFGESDLKGAEALVEESGRLDAERDPIAAEDVAVARAYLQLARSPLPDAIVFIFRSVEAHPTSVRLRLLYGVALTRNGEHYLAGRVLEKLSSGNGLVLSARAELAWREGQREEARALLRSAEGYGLPAEEVQLGLARFQIEENVEFAALGPLQGLAQVSELPTRQRAWASLLTATVQHARGGHVMARQSLAHALATRPVGDAEFTYFVGRLLLAEHRLDRARQEASDALRSSPRDARFIRLLAAVELAMDRPAEALQRLIEPALGEIEGEGRLLLAEAFLKSGSPGRAQEALRWAPEGARRRLLAARIRLAAGKPYAALRELNSAGTAGVTWRLTDRAEQHIVRGLAALSVEDNSEAARSFQAALRLDPQCAEAHWQLGLLARRAGNGEQARVALEQAVAANPYLRQARVDLARLQLSLGNIAAAQAQFDEVLALDDNNLEALIGRARAAVELQGKDADFYLRALNMRGHRVAAALLSARRLMVTGRWAEASAELAKLTPSDAEARRAALLWTATALHRQGNLAGAAFAYERLLEAAGGRSVEGSLGLSELYLQRGNAGAALSQAQAALAGLARGIFPVSLKVSVKLQLARCYKASNALGLAIAELQEALDLDAGHHGANLELGLIYGTLKQRSRAIRHLAAALKAAQSTVARTELERLCQGLFAPPSGCPAK